MYQNVDLSNQFRFKSFYSIFKQQIPEDFSFSGERHQMWEFVIVTKGKLGIVADTNAFILKQGQAILHEPWEFHRLWNEDKTSEFITFTFTAENMPSYTSKIFEIKDLDKINNILEEMHSVYIFKGGHITQSRINCEIKSQIIIKTLESFFLEAISQKALAKEIYQGKTAKSYAMIVNLLENNLDKNLSLDEIATLCSMSKANLVKIFSKYSGMGVISYYNQMKINYAVPMLKGNMSIKEVAEKLGFENQNYFCTVFKKIKGKAPSHYR